MADDAQGDGSRCSGMLISVITDNCSVCDVLGWEYVGENGVGNGVTRMVVGGIV